MAKKLTTEEFIEKAKLVHGNKYDYSLVEYKNTNIKIKIICKIHGLFNQIPKKHLSGSGCPRCGNSIKYTKEEFINLSNKIHNNKFDYNLVEYINNHTKIKILCPFHGMFEQTPNAHLSKKQGCKKCDSDKKRKDLFILINKCNEIHNFKYEYNDLNYKNMKTKVKIFCKEHGYYYQKMNDHINGHGCPKCNQSKGEKKIKKILSDFNINFIEQKLFDNCKNKRKLPFDFYLSDYNICIEYDGEQHYKINEYFGGNKGFNDRQINDKIKNEYCLNNNIRLLRIKYNECVEEKLKVLIDSIQVGLDI